MYTKIKFGFLCCLFSYFQCFSFIFCHDIRIKPHLALLFPFISLFLCVRIYDQRKETGILRERRKIFWQKCLVWWYRVLCVKGVRNRRDFHVSSWVGLELTLNYLLLSLITTTFLYSKEMKEGNDIGFAFSNVRDEYSNIGHVCGLVNNNLSTLRQIFSNDVLSDGISFYWSWTKEKRFATQSR